MIFIKSSLDKSPLMLRWAIFRPLEFAIACRSSSGNSNSFWVDETGSNSSSIMMPSGKGSCFKHTRAADEIEHPVFVVIHVNVAVFRNILTFYVSPETTVSSVIYCHRFHA